ncbi:tRNA pseudouridine(55) synthase TruB [Legionella impletisoli]|uniref:tRNA pseudouridine synthase B n=1 Tax=Legionella impletisoli TaxID=343510 RepID=A0A917JSF4_9GAMM|nr:tRNA pseudouridine(55) synthase TruB [Legionella impletisoli]GGI84114.1 tRNA pseudouridine synthase B [Legionella impletisoli]
MSRANKRAVHGILLLNKPEGCTSNYILQKVKHLYNAKKAGHTGSLDPLATGMLPICFGEAAKFSQYLLNADKEYVVVGQLGVKTSTADATGEVLAVCEQFSVTQPELLDVLLKFKGRLKQVPSMFSALKHQGVPLYRLARAGKEVERKARDITIHALNLNAFDGTLFNLTVRCSKGTYIRNLVEDIGDELGVGAHVVSLHRTYTSGFEEDKMHTLDELTQCEAEELLTYLLPIDRAVEFLPKIELTDDDVIALRQGKPIAYSQRSDAALFRLYHHELGFIGLGEFDQAQQLRAKRLISFSKLF